MEKYYFLCRDGAHPKLFLNVNPMVIHDKQFHVGFTSRYLKKYNLEAENIIFEVTERSAVEDIRGFKDTIRHYKSQGYEIAIDDVGSCYSGLNLICDIVPHYLKLDIALIRDIHKDMIKYAMVKSMVEFAKLTNIQLIAEGIECEEELKCLLKLGVHNGQGYFLRKPNEDFKEVETEAGELIKKYSKKREKLCGVEERRVVLFKLENDKAYRAYCRKYGDEKGDAVIEMLKETVVGNVSEKETVTMLDADTIVAIVKKGNCKLLCETIASAFRRKIRQFYGNEDLEKGYMDGTNKHGGMRQYPLIDIATERIF